MTPRSPTGTRGRVPFGGVGGTRIGVKCLHAHVAYTLAGGDDPVGQWTLDQIARELADDRPVTHDDGAIDGRRLHAVAG